MVGCGWGTGHCDLTEARQVMRRCGSEKTERGLPKFKVLEDQKLSRLAQLRILLSRTSSPEEFRFIFHLAGPSGIDREHLPASGEAPDVSVFHDVRKNWQRQSNGS